MAVTPNYSWPVPVNTDLVKDGAEAIKDLGDAIDSTVFGLPSGALTLISATTIGTAVSSVTVTGAFSATYDAYKIIVTGGATSVGSPVALQLGSVTSAYKYALVYGGYVSGSVGTDTAAAAASFTPVGRMETNGISANIELANPFLACQTRFFAPYSDVNNGGSISGLQDSATSFTSFIISRATGTMTGGTIAVYGYEK